MFDTTAKKTLDTAVPLVGATAVTWYFFNRKAKLQPSIWAGLLAGIVLYVLVSQATRLALKGATDRRTLLMQEEKTAQYGITPAEYGKAQVIADKIYHAFHDSSWSEDEDAAINALNSAGSLPIVRAVNDLYQSNYGVSLKADFDRYCSSYNYWSNPVQEYIRAELQLL